MEIEDRREDVAFAKELYQLLSAKIAMSSDNITPTSVHTALILLVDTFCYATDKPIGEFCQRLIEHSRIRANTREEKAKNA
jgi:hypothetical protein